MKNTVGRFFLYSLWIAVYHFWIDQLSVNVAIILLLYPWLRADLSQVYLYKYSKNSGLSGYKHMKYHRHIVSICPLR